jgi:hypothetical protein
MPQQHARDLAAEPDPLRTLRERREHEEKLVRRHLGLEHADALEDVVVGYERDVETHAFGELGLLDDGVDAALRVPDLAAADLDRELE